LVNGVFGAALSVIGFGVARRARWAYRALTIACWASIAVLAVLAKPTLAPFFALAGNNATAGRGMLIAGVVLLVAQIAAVLWFLRYWRKPEVRDAFR
jgi:H+/gluconate symporter-like permease